MKHTPMFDLKIEVTSRKTAILFCYRTRSFLPSCDKRRLVQTQGEKPT